MTQRSRALELTASAEAELLRQRVARAAADAPPAARAEALQRRGRALIVTGFVITILGVALYCAACFAGGVDAGIGDILFDNAVPFAQGTLAVLGLGTLVWLIGSFTYLRGAMDADEAPPDDGGPEAQ